jgi:hypothetical protein
VGNPRFLFCWDDAVVRERIVRLVGCPGHHDGCSPVSVLNNWDNGERPYARRQSGDRGEIGANEKDPKEPARNNERDNRMNTQLRSGGVTTKIWNVDRGECARERRDAVGR